MGGNLVETLIGAIVLAVAAVFFVFVYSKSDFGSVTGYDIFAKFDSVDGLVTGADVRMSGIKVGTVVDQTLDPQTYLARVEMSIDPAVMLPEDSSAEIVSEGLLGGKYMSLTPGAAEAVIKPGGEIIYTQASVNFEQLLGKFIFSQENLK